jgi:nitrile hydratase subunit alpha
MGPQEHRHDRMHGHDHDHAEIGQTGGPGYYEIMETAVRELLIEKRLIGPDEIRRQIEVLDSRTPALGAKVVARAWVDPEFRKRLLANGREAVAELGLTMPKHHRHLVVLENAPSLQNVICCTQCSCTAFSLIGLPPDWYKDLEFRARVVRESRTVLKEMGLDLAPEVQIRVWDTTADTRYMVLPERPPGTDGWSEERLAGIVTRDALIGVARLQEP